MKTQADEKSSAVPLSEIAQQLCIAASSNPWRPGNQITNKSTPVSLSCGTHAATIDKSLKRASRKTFVRAIKPLRRVLRNQGAVNDSLIEALFHLSAQTQEMLEELGYLQKRVESLEAEMRRLRGEEDSPAAPPKH